MSNLINKAGKLGFLIVLVMLASSLRAQDLASTIKLTQGEQFDVAKAAYEKLIAAEPTNGDNYFYLGENYVMSFFADTVTVSLADISTAAKAVFNKGVEVDPENPLNYIGLAKIALINRDTAAARYLNLAFSKLPSKTNKTSKLTPERQALTYAKAAEALIQTPYKSVAKAEELIEKAAALDTKNPEIYLIWGDVYLENNDGSNAKAKYNLAQDLNPNSPAAKLRVGKLWVRAKNWTDAIASYNEALAIDPNFAPAYVELGAIYLKANQPAKAKEYFEKYLQISPTLSAKLKYLSVLLSLKDWTNAIPVALDIKQADPSRNDINRALAYCYFETKNYPKALESIETFFKNTTPEKIINSDYVYYGDILSKSKKDSLAIIQYNKALEQNPENYDMYSKIADSYKALKKSDLSIEWYNKKWKLGKMNVADYYKLGSTYYGQAQTLLADSLYKMADSCFAQITKVQPNFQGGKAMLWRGRCNSGLDPESTKGLANPYYDAFVKIAITDSVKNAKDLIEAYKYFQYYYTKLNDYCTAITYIQKIIWTDPEDKYGTDIPMWKDVLTDYGKKCTK
jgi:tetratricopeptide (TPR) repeat protein